MLLVPLFLELLEITSDILSFDIISSVLDFSSLRISSTPTGAAIFLVPLLNADESETTSATVPFISDERLTGGGQA